MSSHREIKIKTNEPRRSARLVVVAAAVLTGSLAAGASAAAEDAEFRDVVALMPAGWPATQAMRRTVGESVVALMPAGWPATQAMLRATEWA